jgi:hypothetical protein
LRKDIGHLEKDLLLYPFLKGVCMKSTVLFLLFFTVLRSASAQTDSIFVKIAGDTVHIWNTDIMSNCVSKFSLSVTIFEKRIAIIECDTIGSLADCLCNFDLCASVTGLTPGTYTAVVYRQMFKKYFYPVDTVIVVDSLTFTLAKPSSLSASSHFVQSACKSSIPEEQTYTARYWYSSADSAARKLHNDAAIQSIISNDVSLDGTASAWKYIFMFNDEINKRPGYLYFHNTQDGILLDSISYSVKCCIQNITWKWFDSDSALVFADVKGGKTFRENNPDYFITTTLFEALVPNPYPCWEVTYYSKSDVTKNFSTHFDARKLGAPVDVFPLAVGNHWTYGYFWHSINQVNESYDSGTVAILVIGKINAADSTRWVMQQTRQLWSWNYPGTPNEPRTTIDSIEIIEMHQGQHQLYMAGEMNNITRSVFPFFRHRDTVVLRYNAVSDQGTATVISQTTILPGIINYTFRQGIGLSSVFVSDGCTCLTGYSGNHILRDYTITGIANPHEKISLNTFRLYQNYPNPFNPTTVISYQLPVNSFVALKVYDLLGREIATLVNEKKDAGNYSVQWNALSVVSGMYLYRLTVGTYSETKKLIVIR